MHVKLTLQIALIVLILQSTLYSHLLNLTVKLFETLIKFNFSFFP